mmetsp:Transcript_23575/g.54771  ORF Transcript_23575/g.54771 Transcript_23575/m.54771 type:complete len:248 (+) Transcript_23575:3047-3790(+)
MDVVDGVLEVRQSIGTRSCTNQPLTLAAAEKAHVLHHVSNSLLVWVLIYASHMKLDVSLESFWWHCIPEDDISQSIGEHPPTYTRMRWQGPRVQTLRCFRPLDKAALRSLPMRLPVDVTEILDLVRKGRLSSHNRLDRLCRLYVLQTRGLLGDLHSGGILLRNDGLACPEQLQRGVGHPVGAIPNAERAGDGSRIHRWIGHKRPSIRPPICMWCKRPLVGLVVQQVDSLAIGREPELHVHGPSIALL